MKFYSRCFKSTLYFTLCIYIYLIGWGFLAHKLKTILLISAKIITFKKCDLFSSRSKFTAHSFLPPNCSTCTHTAPVRG
jgi:hypothetical protein